MSSGLPSALTIDSSTTTLLTFSSVGSSYMVSSRICSRIERSPRAPVLRASALRDRAERRGAHFQLHAFHVEQALVLLDERVLRLGENLDQRALVELFE